MAITGINNSRYTSYYASSYKNTVKKADCDIQKTKENSQVGKTDVRIAPEVLNRMMSNPNVAAKYENMLSKIPALDRWADSMIKSMTGSEVKYRQVWIDKDGNMGSMVVTGPSEEQKKADEDRKIEEKKMKKNWSTSSIGGSCDVKA